MCVRVSERRVCGHTTTTTQSDYRFSSTRHRPESAETSTARTFSTRPHIPACSHKMSTDFLLQALIRASWPTCLSTLLILSRLLSSCQVSTLPSAPYQSVRYGFSLQRGTHQNECAFKGGVTAENRFYKAHQLECDLRLSKGGDASQV